MHLFLYEFLLHFLLFSFFFSLFFISFVCVVHFHYFNIYSNARRIIESQSNQRSGIFFVLFVELIQIFFVGDLSWP